MHRIDSAGNVLNRFSNGNPATGQRATVVDAAWLNSVQEEIVHVIAQAGIALDKGVSNQLYLAIVSVAAGAAGGGGAADGTPDVPTTRLISTEGPILKGGGTLANDLLLDVDAATAAEVIAATRADAVITPAALAAAAGAVFSTTGYIRLPGGLIVQWGVGSAAGNSTTVITLPTTFPSACLFAGVSGGSSDTNAQDNDPFVSGRGVGSISIFSARDPNVSINWIAIGF